MNLYMYVLVVVHHRESHAIFQKKYFTIFVDVLSIHKHLNLSVQKNNSQISTNIRHFHFMGIYHLTPHGKYQKLAILESTSYHHIAIIKE